MKTTKAKRTRSDYARLLGAALVISKTLSDTLEAHDIDPPSDDAVIRALDTIESACVELGLVWGVEA